MFGIHFGEGNGRKDLQTNETEKRKRTNDRLLSQLCPDAGQGAASENAASDPPAGGGRHYHRIRNGANPRKSP